MDAPCVPLTPLLPKPVTQGYPRLPPLLLYPPNLPFPLISLGMFPLQSTVGPFLPVLLPIVTPTSPGIRTLS